MRCDDSSKTVIITITLHYSKMAFITSEQADDRKKFLENFTKIITNNKQLLNALCVICVIDGFAFDNHCCKMIGKDKLKIIIKDAVELLVSGKMKVNGKINNWSNGCFGSIWFDMNAKKYGLDSIRGGLYSKETYAGKWEHNKHYLIEIIAEEAN